MSIRDLVVAPQSSTLEVRDHFPGGASIYLLFNSDILNFLLKTNVGRHKRLNFVIFVVWSAWILVGGWQLSGTESLIQSRLNRICCDANLLCSWFYSRTGEAGWVQDFIFLFLMLMKAMKRRGEFKIFLRDPRDGKILLRFSVKI